MGKQILCTIGPASLNPGALKRLEALGVSLFRINLSHTEIEQLPDIISAIRRSSAVPICLDSEGAQVRTGPVRRGYLDLSEGEVVKFSAAPSRSASTIQLTPATCLAQLEPGDLISIDFNSALVHLSETMTDAVVGRVVQGGRVGSRKAVALDRELDLPAITEKDRAAVQIGRDMGIRHYALSFANSVGDVLAMRTLIGDDAYLFAKIESLRGLSDLHGIARSADALLIDRGDLSRQVPLERLPSAQKAIVATGRMLSKPVFVATNLLESMVSAPEPTRAEVNDIYNSLEDGVAGLVLAAETAIGRYPVRCAAMVRRIIEVWEADQNGVDAPRGGPAPSERHWPAQSQNDLALLPRLVVRGEQILDAEQLALSTYAPLRGFMCAEEIETVLDHDRLPDGQPWTMPILLQVRAAQAERLPEAGAVALVGPDGTIRSVLHLREKATLDLDRLARRMFGTTSPKHPGVTRLMSAGDVALAGAVDLVRRLPFSEHAPNFSPRESRLLFSKKGWRRVVGFHSRNVVHRAHEYIQNQALDRVSADGLFLHPVSNPGRQGDFLPSVIFRCYRAAIDDNAYPADSVALGAFGSWPRFAGPREAVFSAMVRRNMGCTHFVVGRDHSGVGNFYAPDAAQRMFERVGEIGIAPIFFEAVSYDPVSGQFAEGKSEGLQPISGTSVRDHLQRMAELPDWLIRPSVSRVLNELTANGLPLFVE